MTPVTVSGAFSNAPENWTVAHLISALKLRAGGQLTLKQALKVMLHTFDWIDDSEHRCIRQLLLTIFLKISGYSQSFRCQLGPTDSRESALAASSAITAFCSWERA